MGENIQPKLFWEGVTDYSQNAMTYTEADFELSQVFRGIDSHKGEEIKGLLCFGVADGLREPVSILKHIDGQHRPLPSTVLANDISENLLNEARRNLVSGGWHTRIGNEIIYSCDKIEAIDMEIENKTKLRMAVIGVYSLGYLKEALHLYKSNAHIVGVNFHVYPVYLNNNADTVVLEHGETIIFNINDLNDDIIRQIHSNVDGSKQLYAQCVYTTDKHFVSHYFNSDPLVRVMRHVFSGYDVVAEQQENNGRYTVVKLQCTKTSGEGITLMTSLNNVLGNIQSDAQIRSLHVMKGILD